MCSGHGGVYIFLNPEKPKCFRTSDLSLSGASATQTLPLGSLPLSGYKICMSKRSAKNDGQACADGNRSPHIPTVQVRLTIRAGRTFLNRRMSAPTLKDLSFVVVISHKRDDTVTSRMLNADVFSVYLHTDEKPLVDCVHRIFKLVFTMCWQHSANWGSGGSDGEESRFLSWGLLIFFPQRILSLIHPSFLK